MTKRGHIAQNCLQDGVEGWTFLAGEPLILSPKGCQFI
jgi:hypothetical protein